MNPDSINCPQPSGNDFHPSRFPNNGFLREFFFANQNMPNDFSSNRIPMQHHHSNNNRGHLSCYQGPNNNLLPQANLPNHMYFDNSPFNQQFCQPTPHYHQQNFSNQPQHFLNLPRNMLNHPQNFSNHPQNFSNQPPNFSNPSQNFPHKQLDIGNRPYLPNVVHKPPHPPVINPPSHAFQQHPLRFLHTPPPHPFYTAPLQNSPTTPILTHKEKMQAIIRNWLKDKTEIEKKNKKEESFLNIFEYKEVMHDYTALVEKLRSLTESLNKQDSQQLYKEGQQCRVQILRLREKMFNANQIEHIRRLVKDRKRKRNRIRRKKKRESEGYLAKLKKRLKLHEEIDECIHKQQTEIMTQKVVENLRNEAGESLSEVKRKQADVKEKIKLYKCLKDLRHLRKQTSIYKGVLATESENKAFEDSVEKILSILHIQKKTYEDEERALRVLREEETEVLNKKQQEKQKKNTRTRRDNMSAYDPLLPFRMYWLQAQQNPSSLLHIRTLWDMFLCHADTPRASRIPESFVSPPDSTSKQWQKFVVKEKK